MAKKKQAKKSVQFYKVVNTINGHNGFFYKMGLNIDPIGKPLEEVGSCEPGALYFVKAEFLSSWSEKGNLIAWVKPVGKYKADEGGGKYKAKKLLITEMLPPEKALPLIPEADLQTYVNFGVKLTEKKVSENQRFSAVEKFIWFMDRDFYASAVKLLVENSSNKQLLEEAKEYENWPDKQIRTFLDNNLEEVISPSCIRQLCYDNKRKLLQEMVTKNPEWFIKIICDEM